MGQGQRSGNGTRNHPARRRLRELTPTRKNLSRHHTHLNARRWQAVRRAVFERDGYRCTACGRAGRLECDHIEPLQREPGQNPYDPDGCQVSLL